MFKHINIILFSLLLLSCRNKKKVDIRQEQIKSIDIRVYTYRTFPFLDTTLEKQRIQAIFHNITKVDTTNCLLGKTIFSPDTITCIIDVINKAEPIQYNYTSDKSFFKAFKINYKNGLSEIFIATDKDELYDIFNHNGFRFNKLSFESDCLRNVFGRNFINERTDGYHCIN